VAEYFEASLAAGAPAKQAANWLMSDITGYLNSEKKAIAEIALTPEAFAELLNLIERNTISSKIAKDLLPELLKRGGSPKTLIEQNGLTQISNPSALEALIDELLVAHPNELEQYRAGKTKLQGFFVGQLMKKTGGRADPKLANQLLLKKLQG
jgi:aspartyl-tRNA(Asn)/glutamyl-tRNA(Gln) amidotransferase subunit B